MDAIWCKEWPIFNTGSLVGCRETARSRRVRHSVSAPTLTWFQLHYCNGRWLSGRAHKVTWPPCSFMVERSPYRGFPFQVTVGRWIEQGILGWVVYLFILEAGAFSSRSREITSQSSYLDHHLLSDVESRLLETSLLKWLNAKHWSLLVTLNPLIRQITTATAESCWNGFRMRSQRRGNALSAWEQHSYIQISRRHTDTSCSPALISSFKSPVEWKQCCSGLALHWETKTNVTMRYIEETDGLYRNLDVCQIPAKLSREPNGQLTLGNAF